MMSKELRFYLWSVNTQDLQSSLSDICSELDRVSQFLWVKEDYTGSTEFHTISCYFSNLSKCFQRECWPTLTPLQTFDIPLTTLNLIPITAHKKLNGAFVAVIDELGHVRSWVQAHRYPYLEEFSRIIKIIDTLPYHLYDSWEVLKSYKPELPCVYSKPNLSIEERIKVSEEYQALKACDEEDK